MTPRLAATVFVVSCLTLGVEDVRAQILEGTITAGRSVETAAPLSVAVDASVCGKDGSIADPRLIVGSARGLADVVVTVTDRVDSPPYPVSGSPMLEQRGCVFYPHVAVVAPGQPLRVSNDDGILHTFRSTGELNRRVNKAQIGGKQDTVAFATPEILVLECDVHYWMSAVVVVAPHAYVAVTDTNGDFRIDGLPPGDYTLELWHQRLGRRLAAATVAAGGGRFELRWD